MIENPNPKNIKPKQLMWVVGKPWGPRVQLSGTVEVNPHAQRRVLCTPRSDVELFRPDIKHPTLVWSWTRWEKNTSRKRGQDPSDRLGLAHFHEHMLFLGLALSALPRSTISWAKLPVQTGARYGKIPQGR